MKPIGKDELYNHVGQFLKGKGIELKDGSYAGGIQKSCALLSDVINLSQKGVERARTQVEKKLDQIRQVIHEKTAPKRTATVARPVRTAKPPKSKAKTSKPGAKA